MSKEHRILLAPGMNGNIEPIKFLTRNWQEKYGLTPEPIQITWKDSAPFQPKLKKIVDAIDEFVEKGDKVSLVGCSAGGPLMINAFIDRKNKVHRVANLSGFLRPGTAKGFRSFETRSAASIAIQEAVAKLNNLDKQLTDKDKEKILTVRPWFDELVPGETVVIQGALNKTVPMFEHVLGISLSLVKYNPLIMFLKG